MLWVAHLWQQSLGFERWLFIWKQQVTFAWFWKSQLEVKENGRALSVFGWLKHSVIQTGVETNNIEDRQAVGFIHWMVDFFLQAAELNVWWAGAHVRVSCTPWFLHFAMESSCVVALNFSLAVRLNTICWLTSLLQDKLPCVKDQVDWHMCQGNCCGFNKLCMKVRYNWHKYPTLWNVADAGTKSLASKRIQMLLHCIGMARSEGGKNHWPGGVWSAISKVFQRKANQCTCQEHCESDCFHGPWAFAGSNSHAPWWKRHLWSQRPMQYRTNHVQSDSYSWMFIMMCSILILAVLAFWGWVCKRADDAYTSFDHVYTQHAILSSAVTILEKKIAQMETDLRRLRSGHAELSGEIEMVQIQQKISSGGW